MILNTLTSWFSLNLFVKRTIQINYKEIFKSHLHSYYLVLSSNLNTYNMQVNQMQHWDTFNQQLIDRYMSLPYPTFYTFLNVYLYIKYYPHSSKLNKYKMQVKQIQQCDIFNQQMVLEDENMDYYIVYPCLALCDKYDWGFVRGFTSSLVEMAVAVCVKLL